MDRGYDVLHAVYNVKYIMQCGTVDDSKARGEAGTQ